MVPSEGPGSGVGSGSAAEGLTAVPRTCPGLTALVKEPWPAVAQNAGRSRGYLGTLPSSQVQGQKSALTTLPPKRSHYFERNFYF